MSINQSVITGKWKEIKGEIRKMWGKLTDDELEQTKGDVQSIEGLLQQKYGHSKESLKSQLEEVLHRFNNEKDITAESIKETLRN